MVPGTIYSTINLTYLTSCILKKYEFDMTKLKITSQAYNRELKSLCTKLKLKDTYTSHDGRDTFITNCINLGVDIPTILSWTGQESYAVMKRYFKIDDNKKVSDMLKLSMYNNNEAYKTNSEYSYEQYCSDKYSIRFLNHSEDDRFSDLPF